ncbi:class I SAM-dependent methyltransferase [Rummeliibacillus pycnus]|uniref:class I SAM-dependent methyltransferase n=1 Tax=Rummeliibacillus pycnus TaxID=101070 RepID=UPI003D26FCD6
MSNSYLDLLAYFGIGGAHPGGFSLTLEIFENEKIQPHHHVLDIGCGTGQTAAFLAKNFGCKVTAIDVNQIMIEKAKKRFENDGLEIDVILGDVQNMNIADHTFDFIISESVISFTNIDKTLHELSRVLKEDGSMIMIEMTAEQILSEKLQRKVSKLYGIDKVLNEKEWVLRLEQNGFQKIRKISTPSILVPSDIEEMDISENISIDFYDLWEEHIHFIEQYGHLIKYRVLECQHAAGT